MTEIKLGLPGKVFRSDMPWSVQYDEDGALVDEFRESNISAVVVLTPVEEMIKNTGKDLLSIYRTEGWDVLHLPVRNLGVPDSAALDATVKSALNLVRSGMSIVVHCHAGIGRTGMFLAAMAGMALDLDAAAAMQYVRQFVFGAVETPEQFDIIDEILSRA